jgi:hypothetical protein
VSDNQLQDIGRNDGISPWVARIVELHRVGEFAKERQYQATNCGAPVKMN